MRGLRDAGRAGAAGTEAGSSADGACAGGGDKRQAGGPLGERLTEALEWAGVLEQVAAYGWTRLDLRPCPPAASLPLSLPLSLSPSLPLSPSLRRLSPSPSLPISLCPSVPLSPASCLRCRLVGPLV